MISVEDIPEMLNELKSGSLERELFYALCMDLFEHHDVEFVLSLLPVELRDDFVADIRTQFDNDTPAEEFLLLSSARGDHPAKVIIINKIRGWLETSRNLERDR